MWLVGALAAAAASATASPVPAQGVPALMPHPAKLGASPESHGWERARVNEACELCHADIAAEQRESRHREAFSNEPFQQALAREHPSLRAFCQGCHAPEASPLVPPRGLVADMGVGCVTCHAPLGPVLAAPGASSPPHVVLRSPAFATDEACAGCHDFLFPGEKGRAGQRMQSTVTEHREASDRRSCADCHMPLTSGPRPHKSHRFPGGYEEDLVRSALEIRAERTSATEIDLHISPRGVTHAVPTGDLFRRLAVEVQFPEAPRKRPRVIYLARHFAREGGMREVKDDRVRSGERLLELTVAPGPVRVLVRYERVGHHSSPDERDAEVLGSILLWDVTLGSRTSGGL